MSEPNRDQKDFWTDQAGPKWVAQQREMDTLLAPVLDGVLTRANLSAGDRILDIGCGTGESTIRASDIAGPAGQVEGVDISTTLLGLARKRTRTHPNISLTLCDAATKAFETKYFDHLISRFGVMFFEDSVAAFRNMAEALKPGAGLTFATWGQIDANPYFKTAAKAARETLGPVPKSDPDLPGPFAFRDPERVIAILHGAGLAHISVEVVDLALIPSGGLHGLAETCCAIGPAEKALTHYEADKTARAELIANLEAHFARFETKDGLRIPAEINFVTARTTV